MRVLDGFNVWSLAGFGCGHFAGVRWTGFADGDYLWDLSLGQHTGNGKFDGETFGVCCGWFVLGGVGEGKRRL